MKTLPTFTIDDIRAWNPCYDPVTGQPDYDGGFLPEDWRGNALDILAIDECLVEDRFWVVLREDCIDAKTIRLFAVWCAREALKLIESPDHRSINACDVAEQYAHGNATDEELSAAGSAAWSAAGSAAWSAAWSAQLTQLRQMLLAAQAAREE